MFLGTSTIKEAGTEDQWGVGAGEGRSQARAGQEDWVFHEKTKLCREEDTWESNVWKTKEKEINI